MWDNNDTVIVNNLSGQFIGTTPVLCHKLKNKVRIKMNECESDTALNSLMHINVYFNKTEAPITQEIITTKILSITNHNDYILTLNETG